MQNSRPSPTEAICPLARCLGLGRTVLSAHVEGDSSFLHFAKLRSEGCCPFPGLCPPGLSDCRAMGTVKVKTLGSPSLVSFCIPKLQRVEPGSLCA